MNYLYKGLHIEVLFYEKENILRVNGYGNINHDELKPAMQISAKYVERYKIRKFVVNESEVFSLSAESRLWLLSSFIQDLMKKLGPEPIEFVHIPSRSAYMQSMSRLISGALRKIIPTYLYEPSPNVQMMATA